MCPQRCVRGRELCCGSPRIARKAGTSDHANVVLEIEIGQLPAEPAALTPTVVTADCHYENTLRDDEAGCSVEHVARERNVRTDRIGEIRAAVRRACNGEHSRTKAQAGHEDGILWALLHFRSEMSDGLR